jgi:hypothetical protein
MSGGHFEYQQYRIEDLCEVYGFPYKTPQINL